MATPNKLPNSPASSNPKSAQALSSPISHVVLGSAAVFLATIVLALHNVIIGLVGDGGQVWGGYPISRLLELSPANAMFILWLRMLAVMPLMAGLYQWLYPSVWQEVQQILIQKDRKSLRHILMGGFFLFLSQSLLYLAIGRIGPGIATALFFLYPLATTFLIKPLGDNRTALLGPFASLCLVLGGILAAYPSWFGSARGAILALLSGVAFSFYQLSGRKLHPVPVTMIQFFVMFGLSSLSLIVFPANLAIPSGNLLGLLLLGLGLGVLISLSYGLNYVGMQLVGTKWAAGSSAGVPLLTCLFSIGLMPQVSLSQVQWFGVLMIAVGTAAFSLFRNSRTIQKVQAKQ